MKTPANVADAIKKLGASDQGVFGGRERHYGVPMDIVTGC